MVVMGFICVANDILMLRLPGWSHQYQGGAWCWTSVGILAEPGFAACGDALIPLLGQKGEAAADKMLLLFRMVEELWHHGMAGPPRHMASDRGRVPGSCLRGAWPVCGAALWAQSRWHCRH